MSGGDVTPINARRGYVLSLADLMGTEEPDDDDSEDWIIRGIIPRGAPSFIAGPPKSGKTWAALDLAISVATGTAWLGQLENTAKGPQRVLVLPMEDSRRNIRTRLWPLARGRGLVPADLHGWLSVNPDEPFYFDNGEHVARMRCTLDAWQPQVVIVDSLARAFLGDENDKRDIGTLTRPWSELCRDYGASVVVIHHLRKSAGADESLVTALRGSGDLPAFARHICGMRRRPDGFVVVDAVGNFEPQWEEPWAWELITGETDGRRSIRLAYRGPAKSAADADLDERVIAYLRDNGHATGKAIEENVEGKGERIRVSLKRLERAGTVGRAGGPRSPYHLLS